MTGTERSKSKPRVRWQRWLSWWPALAIALAFALGWAAAGLRLSGFGAAHVTLGEQFGGTVTEVTSDGSGICLTEDATGRQRCSSPLQLAESAPLRVGEHVEVTVTTVRIDEGLLQEVYIVTVPPPVVTDGEGEASAR